MKLSKASTVTCILTTVLEVSASAEQQPWSTSSAISIDIHLNIDLPKALPLTWIKHLEQQDVVSALKLAGYGEGLEDVRLVHVFSEEEPKLMTEGDKLRLKKLGSSFMDITDQPRLGQLNAFRSSLLGNADSTSYLPTTIKAKSRIEDIFIDVDDSFLRADIEVLSSFWNRNYQSPFGAASSEWIYQRVQGILNETQSDKVKMEVERFKHRFVQNSVIARIEAASDSDATTFKDKKRVILGAHQERSLFDPSLLSSNSLIFHQQDSLNYKLPFYRAPGADDDGSGSVTILQVLRSIVNHSFVPPPGVVVEFHWYAAEEGGLLGSQDVAAKYEEDAWNVKGMLQMDMTAFLKHNTTPIIGIFTDRTSANLTSFTEALIDAYLAPDGVGWNETGCGAICGSDHFSWTKAGYKAAMVTEALFENFPRENVHTANDDTYQDGQYSFEHMLRFVKLGIAFVTELSMV